MHNGKDEQAIGALIVEMTEGFNRHNSKAATRMYSSDADLVTVRGEAFKGRAGIREGIGSGPCNQSQRREAEDARCARQVY